MLIEVVVIELAKNIKLTQKFSNIIKDEIRWICHGQSFRVLNLSKQTKYITKISPNICDFQIKQIPKAWNVVNLISRYNLHSIATGIYTITAALARGLRNGIKYSCGRRLMV